MTPPAPTEAHDAHRDVSAMIGSVAYVMLGTRVGTSVSLMTAGLDSIAAAEMAQTLSAECELEISPTTLFDHPTVDSVASLL